MSLLHCATTQASMMRGGIRRMGMHLPSLTRPQRAGAGASQQWSLRRGIAAWWSAHAASAMMMAKP